MSDHYHYASEVQGAAADNHIHTPRDIGAADEHDVEMLKRDVRAAEANIAALERQNNKQHAENLTLIARIADLEESFRQRGEHLIQLTEQIGLMARHLAQR